MNVLAVFFHLEGLKSPWVESKWSRWITYLCSHFVSSGFLVVGTVCLLKLFSPAVTRFWGSAASELILEWGTWEARAEGRGPKGRYGVGFSEGAASPLQIPPANGFLSAVSSPSGVRGNAPTAEGFFCIMCRQIASLSLCWLVSIYLQLCVWLWVKKAVNSCRSYGQLSTLSSFYETPCI